MQKPGSTKSHENTEAGRSDLLSSTRLETGVPSCVQVRTLTFPSAALHGGALQVVSKNQDQRPFQQALGRGVWGKVKITKSVT